MTVQFKYESSIVLLPLIRLIIEFEWGSLYINLRIPGIVSNKTKAHETTNLQITSVLDMADRTTTTTVMLFCYVNTGARLQMHFEEQPMEIFNALPAEQHTSICHSPQLWAP